jgi:hypothetical protein
MIKYKEEEMKSLFGSFLIISLTLVFSTFVWSEAILYFSFDGTTGDTVKDLTGNGNDGQLKDGAAITSDGKYGDALEIDGVNAVMEVESAKALEEYQDNTYMWWLKFTEGSDGSWRQIIVKKAPGSDRSPGVWINPDGTGIHYRYNAGNMGASRVGPGGEGNDFELNIWYHIAGVKKGNNLKVYIDGKEEGSYDVPEEHAQGTEKLYVGKTGFDPAWFIMDDLVVYDSALTAEQVQRGMIVAVSPGGKLTSTWANIKATR